ncbi:hypothetical protein Tco_0401682, partial [Tanacetum coccineum]
MPRAYNYGSMHVQDAKIQSINAQLDIENHNTVTLEGNTSLKANFGINGRATSCIPFQPPVNQPRPVQITVIFEPSQTHLPKEAISADAYANSAPDPQTDVEIQLKASRDRSFLLRELKTVKADLAFAKERCGQLEEENRIPRECGGRDGDNPEDEDLIRSLQLESPVTRAVNEPDGHGR